MRTAYRISVGRPHGKRPIDANGKVNVLVDITGGGYVVSEDGLLCNFFNIRKKF
jgi:hypothetical protein